MVHALTTSFHWMNANSLLSLYIAREKRRVRPPGLMLGVPCTGVLGPVSWILGVRRSGVAHVSGVSDASVPGAPRSPAPGVPAPPPRAPPSPAPGVPAPPPGAPRSPAADRLGPGGGVAVSSAMMLDLTRGEASVLSSLRFVRQRQLGGLRL